MRAMIDKSPMLLLQPKHVALPETRCEGAAETLHRSKATNGSMAELGQRFHYFNKDN